MEMFRFLWNNRYEMRVEIKQLRSRLKHLEKSDRSPLISNDALSIQCVFKKVDMSLPLMNKQEFDCFEEKLEEGYFFSKILSKFSVP